MKVHSTRHPNLVTGLSSDANQCGKLKRWKGVRGKVILDLDLDKYSQSSSYSRLREEKMMKKFQF